MTTAALLVNLGSPDTPTEKDVRTYLNEFLMDPFVINTPWLIRRLIVSLFVLPKRPAESAKAYQSVWTDEGSPLVSTSIKLAEKVREQLPFPVDVAMRYGKPNIEQVILKLYNTHKMDKLILFPMYPHYAMSTVKTVIENTKAVIAKHQLPLSLIIQPCFYDNSDYVNALIAVSEPWLKKSYDHLVFSYHGLPESHLRQDDPTKKHCLKRQDCCEIESEAHATCYRHQVYRTTACFVDKANIPKNKYSIAFQSKLGRNKWLEPSTVDTLHQLVKDGKKRVLVICPAFVSDCLETLEEIAMAAKKEFIAAGGESLELIPCLNTNQTWVELIVDWLKQQNEYIAKT